MFRYKLSPLSLGVVLVALANLRLFFPNVSVSWDGTDEMWNYLRFMGSALREGNFPDFFPNVVSGYPLGANIQAGVYNVFYLIIAFLFPTSVYSVNAIFIITHILLYLTTYKIGETYGLEPKICLYVGLAAVASGFIIGNASHMSYGAATLGLASCFLALRLALDTKTSLGFFLSLGGTYHSLTSGYPAVTIFGAQIISGYWIYLLVTRQENCKALVTIAVGASLGLLLSLPALIHLHHQSKNWSRVAGVSLEMLAEGSMPITSLLNFLVPALPSNLIKSIATYPPDQTMVRFHLLFLSVAGLYTAIYFLRDNIKKRIILPWLIIAAIATWLALGANANPPLRMWLAEYFFIYRLGRFPSGEHRGIALFALLIPSAYGLSILLNRYSWFNSRFITILVFDFLLIMVITHKMRSSGLESSTQLPVPMYKIVFKGEDRHYIDFPRNCSGGPVGDPSQAGYIIKYQKERLAPTGFLWTGYTNLIDSRYEQETNIVADIICGASRLYRWPTRETVGYELDLYTPGFVRFTIDKNSDPDGQEEGFVWSDYNDGFWVLTVNGIEKKFEEGPAALRYFSAKPHDKIEMKYLGPLSRYFR